MHINSSAELSAFLKSMRKKKGLSQAEVGERVGLRQKTISDFENNPEGTKVETLFRLLAALGMGIQVSPRGSTPSHDGWKEEW